MPAVVIEPASAGDVDALVRLLGILFTQESEMSPDAAKQRRGIERILGNAAIGQLFVARDASGAVAGTCCLLFSESTFLGERAAWLEDVVVDPTQRGAGVGAALLDHVIAYCERENIKRVSLLTDRDNRNAQGFYESRGFERSAMVLYRRYDAA